MFVNLSSYLQNIAKGITDLRVCQRNWLKSQEQANCEELLSGCNQALSCHQLFINAFLNACSAKNLFYQKDGEKSRWRNVHVQSCEQDWLFFYAHLLL